MAERWASIYGTEKDKFNCPFYFKIGSCRHGDKCARAHNRPTISPTILMPSMYQFPEVEMTEEELQENFDNFYEDVHAELTKFGALEELFVCANLGEHLLGNVYAKFRDERDADAAQKALDGRYYAGRLIKCEFSPVTDFREAKCRQYDNGDCGRGGYCNFMHLKAVSPDLDRDLWGSRRRRSDRRRSRSPRRDRRRRSRSRSRDRRRSKSKSRSRSRSGSEERRKHKSRRSSRSHRSRSRDRDGSKKDSDRDSGSDRKERRRHRSRSRSTSRSRSGSPSSSRSGSDSRRKSDRHSRSPDTKRQKLQEDDRPDVPLSDPSTASYSSYPSAETHPHPHPHSYLVPQSAEHSTSTPSSDSVDGARVPSSSAPPSSSESGLPHETGPSPSV